MLPSIVIFLLILSLLVFIHELGHFVSARKFGVRVEEFGLGLPPRALGKKIGETIYSLNWLPIGGFVRIKGEDFEDYDPNDDENFINKHPWKKSVILLAGIFMNLVLAVGIFYFVLGTAAWRSAPLVVLADYDFPYGTTVEVPNVVMGLAINSPADEAGMEFGDQIISVSYEDQYAEPKNTEDLRVFLEDKTDLPVQISTKNINTEEENTYTVTPVYNETIDQAALGVQLGEVVQLDYSKPKQKAFAGFSHSVNIMGYSFKVMSSLVSASFEARDVRPVAQGVSGPVGMFSAVQSINQFAGDKAFLALLDLTALLSLSLAIMNLLPLPALDGGRWVFVLYEWMSGKKPSQKLEARAHQVGFIFLLGLIVLITFKDIFQFLI